MGCNRAIVGALTLFCMIASAIILPGATYALDAKVMTAMGILKSKAEKLGPAKVEGTDTVAGKKVPAIYFGAAKQDNDFALVDGVAKETGGIATIFVKSGDEFVRVATNLKGDDGKRVTGTNLDPKGKAIEAIKKGEAYYGDIDILGKPYSGGYEPIRDAAKNVIGIYFVGYAK
jgi:Cache 3/Cache 2 fusion domain